MKFPAQLESTWESMNRCCNVGNLYLWHLLGGMLSKVSLENNVGVLLSMHGNSQYLENWEGWVWAGTG